MTIEEFIQQLESLVNSKSPLPGQAPLFIPNEVKQSLYSQPSVKAAAEQAAAIQETQLGEDARLMDLEREGELISREAEMGKVSSLLGMAADEAAAARQAQAEFRDQMFEGVSDVGSALVGMDGAKGGVGGEGGTVSNVSQDFIAKGIADGTIDPSIDTPEKFKEFIQGIKF